MTKNKGTRPDYTRIIFWGAFISLLAWTPIFILSAAAGMEAEEASGFSICLILLFFPVYVFIAVKNRERLGIAIYTEAYLRERSGGVLMCDACGAQTVLENVYRIEPPLFYGKQKVYCPACASSRKVSQFRKSLAFYGITALAGLALIATAPESLFGWMFLNFFLGIIFMIISIVPHELGHVIAGALLGMSVHKVTIGYGRLVYAAQFFGKRVEFRALPIGGLTYLLNKSARFFRLRKLIAVAAGPLVNLLIVLILIKVYSLEWLLAADFGGGLEPEAALLIANVMLLVFSLLPNKVVSAAGIIPNDGANLLSLPFMKKPKIAQFIAAAYAYEGLEYRRKKDWDAARNCYEEALAKFPDNLVSLNDKAAYFIETGDIDKARDVLLGMLETPGIEPGTLMGIKNNLALADAVSGRADLVDEADRLSEEAFNNVSWLPVFRGTRGIVLVELGRIEEGIVLLKEAADKNEDSAAKATYYCYVAIAEARTGNSEAARRYIEDARKLDPASNLIARAMAEAAGTDG